MKGPWERRTKSDAPFMRWKGVHVAWADGYNAALNTCRPDYDAVVAERDRWKARALAVHAAHLEEAE